MSVKAVAKPTFTRATSTLPGPNADSKISRARRHSFSLSEGRPWSRRNSARFRNAKPIFGLVLPSFARSRRPRSSSVRHPGSGPDHSKYCRDRSSSASVGLASPPARAVSTLCSSIFCCTAIAVPGWISMDREAGASCARRASGIAYARPHVAVSKVAVSSRVVFSNAVTFKFFASFFLRNTVGVAPRSVPDRRQRHRSGGTPGPPSTQGIALRYSYTARRSWSVQSSNAGHGITWSRSCD